LRTLHISLFISFVFILLTGCFSSKPKPFIYPKWFTQLRSDTPISYYASAEGASKKEAISTALNGIASKISVSIESSYSSHTQSAGDQYSKSSEKRINNKVKKIELTSYRVIKFKVIDGKYLVLLSLDRSENANIKVDKVNVAIQNANRTLNTPYTNNVLKLKALNLLLKDIEQNIIPMCFIVKSLDNSIEVDSKITKLLEIKSKIKIFKNNLSFGFLNNKYPLYKNVISELLSEEKLSLLYDATLIISISAKEEQVKVMNNYVHKAKITIFILENNQIVTQKLIIVGAKSTTSFAQAKEFSIKDFRQKLKDDHTLNKLIGLE
jgi:hypothetical protein